MTKEMMIQAMVDSAAKDLEAIKDPYQRGRLALEIARILHTTSAVVSYMEDKTEEKTAEPVKAVVEEPPKPIKVVDVPSDPLGLETTPASSKEETAVNDILEQPSRKEEEAPIAAEATMAAPTKDVLENTPRLHDLNPNAKIADKLNTAIDPAVPEVKEIDINSDEWKNKHLAPDEIDAEWTPAMKANKELVTSVMRMKKICIDGLKSGFIKEDWLNARIQEASSRRFMSYKDKGVFSPQVIRLIESYVSGKVTELVKAAKANKKPAA